MILRKLAFATMGWLTGIFVLVTNALAQDGLSTEWQIGLQTPATPLMQEMQDFHTAVFWLITVISIFVLAIIGYIIVKFNKEANPVPSKTTHNATLEVAWTVIPILILVLMAIPSFKLHYKADVVQTLESVNELYKFTDKSGNPILIEDELTIKASGFQWAWMYDYPDYGVQGMDAFCAAGPATYCLAEAGPDDNRLLETSNRVVVPVNTLVRMQITAEDVIHNWTVPAFGVKIDAVPGRMHETWFVATREGTFYGQCSELCGTYHGFMPIAVDVVSMEEFELRIEELADMFPAF